MPTYEYVCEKCGHQFELFQPISAASLRICPEKQCAQQPWGKGRVKRMICKGGGLIFKGSGFYSTDYRSESYKAGAKKESESAKPPAGDGKPASTPSESKPAKAEPAKS